MPYDRRIGASRKGVSMVGGKGSVRISVSGKLLPVIGLGLAVLAAVALVAGFLWAAGTDAGETIDPSDPVLVFEGQELYGEHCASCHGPDREGQPNWQQRDAEGYLPAPPHDETGHTWHHPDELLFTVTKQGTAVIAPEGYKTRMAGFGEVLTDRQIRAVLAHIKSTWPPREREVQERINGRRK